MTLSGTSVEGRLLVQTCALLCVGALIGGAGWAFGRIAALVPDLSVGLGCFALAIVLYGGNCADENMQVQGGLKIARGLAVFWCLWMLVAVLLRAG